MPKARISQNGSFVCGSAPERVFGGLPRSRSGKAGEPCGGVYDAQSHLPGALAGVTLVGSLPDPSAPMVTDEFYARDNPLQNVLGVAWSRVDSGGSEQVEREGGTSDPSQPLLLCHVWQAAESKGQGGGVNTTDPLQRCLLEMNRF